MHGQETVGAAGRVQRGDRVDERPAEGEALGGEPGPSSLRVGEARERAADDVHHARVREIGEHELPVEREDGTVPDDRAVADIGASVPRREERSQPRCDYFTPPRRRCDVPFVRAAPLPPVDVDREVGELRARFTALRGSELFVRERVERVAGVGGEHRPAVLRREPVVEARARQAGAQLELVGVDGQLRMAVEEAGEEAAPTVVEGGDEDVRTHHGSVFGSACTGAW